MKSIGFFLAMAIMVILSSCDKDDDDNVVPKPTISGLELGYGNSHVAYIGADLHMEAEILAEGKIDRITIELHKEDGTGEEIEAEFTEYAGQKNTEFHKHIDIPVGTEAGEYHFHMTVIDQEGNSSSVEADINIKELIDEEKPTLTISSAPTDGQSFANAEAISISGTITDNTGLSGMLVALVYQDDNIADADVTGGNDKVIVMLHTHAFDSPTSHTFTTSIEVGATNDNNMTPAPIEGNNAWKSGKYYILIRSKDVKGNWVFSNHYPVEVNL